MSYSSTPPFLVGLHASKHTIREMEHSFDKLYMLDAEERGGVGVGEYIQ